MALPSEDSQPDYDKINARIQHAHRDSSPDTQPNERAECDFAAVGSIFGGQLADRRSSYPPDLELSECENNDPQPCSPAEPSSIAALPRAGNRALVSSPTTPIRTRAHLGPYIQSDDYRRERQRSARRARRRRRRSYAPSSRRSEEDSTDEHCRSDTTIVYPRESVGHNEDHRSPNATPYFSPSRTPSHRSLETNEDRLPMVEPESPHPFSEYYLYNPTRGRSVLNQVEETFPGNDDRGSG
ncbi:hypothetical protein P280DRAFT_125845 [Massarina eburnea CBS 473.64]|uniref:Uncharacterized protein n=1 Tax=Massarina eburnea CBS 473.64 TaxID=1395130 RepID=A0A6A6SG45_9PLEO|nr:hypothetical protein P280DRAFT_125845 [Massarina eburnea CBS 473.64]